MLDTAPYVEDADTDSESSSSGASNGAADGEQVDDGSAEELSSAEGPPDELSDSVSEDASSNSDADLPPRRLISLFGKDRPLEPNTARLILTSGIQWVRLMRRDPYVDIDLLIQGRNGEHPVREIEVSCRPFARFLLALTTATLLPRSASRPRCARRPDSAPAIGKAFSPTFSTGLVGS